MILMTGKLLAQRTHRKSEIAFHTATSSCGAPGEPSGTLSTSSMTTAAAPTGLPVDTWDEVTPDVLEGHLADIGAEEPNSVPVVIFNMPVPLSVPILVTRPRFASGLVVDPFTDLPNEPHRADGTSP